MRPSVNKKVSYCKQIASQHSCHKYFGQGRQRGQPHANFPLTYTDIYRKNLTLAYRLSRSLEVTGTDLSATYDFLLVISGNYRITAHLSEAASSTE